MPNDQYIIYLIRFILAPVFLSLLDNKVTDSSPVLSPSLAEKAVVCESLVKVSLCNEVDLVTKLGSSVNLQATRRFLFLRITS